MSPGHDSKYPQEKNDNGQKGGPRRMRRALIDETATTFPTLESKSVRCKVNYLRGALLIALVSTLAVCALNTHRTRPLTASLQSGIPPKSLWTLPRTYHDELNPFKEAASG